MSRLLFPSQPLQAFETKTFHLLVPAQIRLKRPPSPRLGFCGLFERVLFDILFDTLHSGLLPLLALWSHPRPEVVWARSGMCFSWNLSAALGRLGRPGLGVPGAAVVFQNILPWLRFPSSNLYSNPKSVHLLRLCHLGLPARPPRLLPRPEKAAFLDASAAGELVLKSLNPPPGRCTSWASSVESETGLLPHHPRPAWMSSRSKASGFMLSPSALSKAWVSSPLARAACGPLASASLESSWGGSGVFLSSFLQRLSFWPHPLSRSVPEARLLLPSTPRSGSRLVVPAA